MCKKSFFLIPFVVMLGLVGLTNAADPYTQDPGPDGLVVVEAENFDENTTNGTRVWEFNTDPVGFSGARLVGIGCPGVLRAVFGESTVRDDDSSAQQGRADAPWDGGSAHG